MQSRVSHRPSDRRPAPDTRHDFSSSGQLPGSTITSRLIVTLAVLACAAISLSFRIADFDLWEHLAIGRAIWALKTVPITELWTWPTYGSYDVNIEWGFQALLWPLWHLWHLWGVYAWNWVAAAAIFSLVFFSARLLGARGHLPLLLLSIGILTYRQRSVGRPETLAALFLALVIVLLELRRNKGVPTLPWIPLVGLFWANSHITFVLGLAVLVVYLIGTLIGRASSRVSPNGLSPSALGVTIGATAAASFLNPFGWHAVLEPFRYAYELRREPMFRGIGELMPLDWSYNLRNGLPLLMVLWFVLLVWRSARKRLDVVECLLFVLFTAITILARRLVGMWAVVATPFIARGMYEWVSSRAWPHWVHPPTRRAVLVASACVILAVPEWLRPEFRPGFGVDPMTYPKHACDFIESHQIRGHSFNHFEFGSYALWRFWPDITRLPFMDTRQAGTPELRRMYLEALRSPSGWQNLDTRMEFSYVLLRRLGARGDRLLDIIDADTTWALVFADDAAALYVRGTRFNQEGYPKTRYWVVPGGSARLADLPRIISNPQARELFRLELDGMVSSSPHNSIASSLRATLNLLDGRPTEASRDLEQAHQQDPLIPRYWSRRGDIARLQGHLQVAVDSYLREPATWRDPVLAVRVAKCYQALGQHDKAKSAYRRAASLGSVEARDSLLRIQQTF